MFFLGKALVFWKLSVYLVNMKDALTRKGRGEGRLGASVSSLQIANG